MPAEAGETLRVSVAYSPRAREVDEVGLTLACGATVGEAPQASGLAARHPALDLDSALLGIWGAPCTRSDSLRDRDRVEVYRPLQVDPKEARRKRQAVQNPRARRGTICTR